MRKIWASMLLLWIMLLPTVPVQAKEGIVIESQTLVVHPDDEGVNVHTILHLVNTSSTPQEVGWELPDNLDQLQILVGQSDVIVADQKRMQRKEPLAGNGDFTIVYKYRYSFPKGTKDFLLPLSYPAQMLQVLVPEENKDIELMSSVIQKQGAMDFQGKPYILYVGNGLNVPVANIQVGSEAEIPPFHSAALIEIWQQSIFHSVNPHLLTAVVVVILAGGGWLAYKRFQKRKGDGEWIADEEEQRFLDLYQQNKILFARLTELQEKLDAGQMSSDEFAEMKAGYKEKLVMVNLELKQLAASGDGQP